MKNSIINVNTISLFILIFCQSINTKAQNWQWAKYAGGSSGDVQGEDVKVGPDGNIYCTGQLRLGQAIFDGDTTGGGGLWNAFVCKYGADGTFKKVVTAMGHDNFTDQFSFSRLVVDENNTVIIPAGYSGNFLLDTFNLTGGNGVLTKFNSNLQCQSIRYYNAGFGRIEKYGNNFYVDGTFSSNGGNIDTFTLTNADHKRKTFAAQLDISGTCKWVKQTKLGDSYVNVNDVRNGKTYISGWSDTCLIFDTAHICSPVGMGVGYAMQCDTAGNIQWLSPFTSKGYVVTNCIKTDAYGNCYVVGKFDSTLTVGNTTLYALPNISYDGFIAKFSSTGSLIWIKQFFSNKVFGIASSYTDNNGSTYITGFFRGRAVFGTDSIDAQDEDMFVARYSNNGECLGFKIVTYAAGLAITQDSSGNAVVTGQIRDVTDFDQIHINSYPGSNFFVAKLDAITGSTGVLRIAEDNRLKIYPNPNNKAFTIEVPQSLVNEGHIQLSIVSSTGSSVKEEQVSIANNKVYVDMGEVQKGIYTVTLSRGHKMFTGRVVVE